MGKKKRQQKLYKKLAQEARKPTLAKILKLMAKTFVLVLVLSFLIAAGIAAGLDWLKTFWAQLAIYGVGYVLAYRWLMSDFMPPPPDKLG